MEYQDLEHRKLHKGCDILRMESRNSGLRAFCYLSAVTFHIFNNGDVAGHLLLDMTSSQYKYVIMFRHGGMRSR